eukprot:326948_1
MVIQLSCNQLPMSFDHLTLPSSHHLKPPDIDIMSSPLTTNSLKHRTSPQYEYRPKNKHLSQQIHKKKKNRNKQTHHKKKKLIKIHKHEHKNKKNTKHQRKPKLKKSKSITRSFTPLHQTEDHIDDPYNDAHYIKKHNQMTQKHKKIQVINSSDQPYYLQPTTISSHTLNNYNYNKQLKHKRNIIWVQSPSPMLLPTNLSATTKLSSPFLLPVPSPYPMLTQHDGAHKGEMLMGFESDDANIIFRSLADNSPQRSQMSVISDYKYEGLQSH